MPNSISNLKKMRIAFYAFIMIFILCGYLLSALSSDVISAESSDSLVYVVPVHEDIEMGIFMFMQRAFREAEEERADHIILNLHTYGGAVDAADEIGKLLQDTQIPTTALVDNNAISAGAFIALNADHIVMVPSATMGAATVVTMDGTAGDSKAQSMWVQKMREAAIINDRDPLYAEAMVDPQIEIEGLTSGEEPLTFGASSAVEHGYAEAVVNSQEEVLEFLGLEGAFIVDVEITWSENLARFITNPIVVSILFSLAGLGLILELYSPGFGVPGIIGLSSLLLFFFGHMVAGFAGWESLILFIAGIILIAIEVMVPGFGIFGILGLVAIGASLALGSTDLVTGLTAIAIAILVTIVVGLVMGRYMQKRGLFTHIVLSENLSAVETTSNFEKKTNELLGKTGVTVSALRPSGTVKIEGKRYDVVSDGSFVEKEIPVKVIFIEGTRIVVSEIDEEEDN